MGFFKITSNVRNMTAREKKAFLASKQLDHFMSISIMMCQVTPTSSVPHQFVERLVDWKIVPSLFCYEVCFSVAKELGWGPFSNIFEIGRTVKKEFFLKIINCLRPRLGSGSLKYFHFHLNNDQIHSPCKSTPKLVHSTGGASLLLW